jgi:hypothetical protein
MLGPVKIYILLSTLPFPYLLQSNVYAYVFDRKQLNITSIVKHTDNSLCEGLPAKYRVMMDQYLGFVPLQESIILDFL